MEILKNMNESKKIHKEISFAAADCNDESWDIIIETLKEKFPDFQVTYGDGNNMTFSFTSL